LRAAAPLAIDSCRNTKACCACVALAGPLHSRSGCHSPEEGLHACSHVCMMQACGVMIACLIHACRMHAA
jgi:hypothetical protein